MPVETWIIIFIVVFISGIVKGTTGFGFALFSLPLLAHFIPIKTLIPLLTLFNLFSSIQIIVLSKGLKLNKRILLLSFTGIIGVFLGTVMLKYMHEFWLKTVCAVVLVILSILFLTGFRFKVHKLRRGFSIAGFISGFLGGSMSVSGPPLALFLTSIKIDSQHFRFTFAWFSIITASVAMFDYIKIGVVYPITFKLFAFSLPVLLASLQLGKYLNKKVPLAAFYKGIVIITLLSGIFLLGSCLKKCLGWI
ncbi:MAG: sulfite exporter TauE/SafE family protein [Bacteroidales bacterium]|nr:sulfite exporter TauE/SafE family protein [Bacteroidales bacterium]